MHHIGSPQDVGPLHLELSGPLDTESAAALRQQLSAAFVAGVTTLVLDVRDVSSCDSTGLGVLRGAAEHLARRSGGLTVTGACPALAASLRVNGLGHLIEPDRPSLRLVRQARPPGVPSPTGGLRSLSAT